MSNTGTATTTAAAAVTATTGQVTPAARRALWLPGTAWAAAGAAAATAVAAVADAVGVSLKVSGDAIPVPAFAQVAFVFSMVGVVMAAAFRRWSAHPALLFTRTTVVLAVLSLLPDLLTRHVDGPTRVSLMLTHVAAAAVVIPGLRSRLR